MKDHRTTVLLVDDTDVLRAYVSEVLQDTGRYRVVEASTGREALGILTRAQDAYSVVVLSCGVPGADGIRVLERFRQAHPDVPVIAVSADPQNRTKALDRGACAFVEKVPSRYMRDLLAVLSEVLRR